MNLSQLYEASHVETEVTVHVGSGSGDAIHLEIARRVVLMSVLDGELVRARILLSPRAYILTLGMLDTRCDFHLDVENTEVALHRIATLRGMTDLVHYELSIDKYGIVLDPDDITRLVTAMARAGQHLAEEVGRVH